MKDVQNLSDFRRISIKKVGVKNISYPIKVLDKAKQVQSTVAKVNMYVNLPHHFKGTHMSRFIEILNRFHGEINLKSLQVILEEMKVRLQAEAAHLEIEFPFFLKKIKPSTEIGIGRYQCRMHGCLAEADDLTLDVLVPISPPMPERIIDVLPRSLGNWGIATISFRFRHFVWLEELVQMIEEVISHNLRLPSSDTTFFDNLPTVESITKALADRLSRHRHIKWFAVRVENLAEGFNTFASLEWPEPAPRHPRT